MNIPNSNLESGRGMGGRIHPRTIAKCRSDCRFFLRLTAALSNQLPHENPLDALGLHDPPPEPLMMLAQLMSRLVFLAPHSGQSGDSSLFDKTKRSNAWSHVSH